MNAGIIAKQMLILFLMMLTGYAAYKKGIVSGSWGFPPPRSTATA